MGLPNTKTSCNDYRIIHSYSHFELNISPEVVLRKLFAILIAIAGTSSIARADLIKTKDRAAVCSNGKQETFIVSGSKSNDWFVYFEGGGVMIPLNRFSEFSNENLLSIYT